MKKVIKWVLIVVISLTVIGMIGIAFDSKKKPGNTVEEKKPMPSNDDVIVLSRYYVKANLKSPKSADFVGDDQVKAYEDSSYIISGHVDATNSFNASIRSKYIAKLKYLGGDKDEQSSWEVEDITIE